VPTIALCAIVVRGDDPSSILVDHDLNHDLEINSDEDQLIVDLDTPSGIFDLRG
jgi:hypothetical protein